jgi:hypothetical protein
MPHETPAVCTTPRTHQHTGADGTVEQQPLVQTGHMSAAQGAGQGTAATDILTPQLMLLPLPIDPATVELLETYDPTHPLTSWKRARDTPIGYMSVLVPAAVHQALMAFPPDPAP